MLGCLLRAVVQLRDPRLRRIVAASFAGALAVFAAVIALLWYLARLWFDPDSMTRVGWIADTLGWLFDLAAGLVAGTVLVWLWILLFPGSVIVIAGLFLDRIAGIVESRDYPALPPARPATQARALVASAWLALRIVGVNLLVLPLYLALTFVPPLGLLLYYAVNSWMIGREYFELVALRRLSARDAAALWRRNRMVLLPAGLVLAVLMSTPFVNLAAPVIGTAFMVHVFHRLCRHPTPLAAPKGRSRGIRPKPPAGGLRTMARRRSGAASIAGAAGGAMLLFAAACVPTAEGPSGPSAGAPADIAGSGAAPAANAPTGNIPAGTGGTGTSLVVATRGGGGTSKGETPRLAGLGDSGGAVAPPRPDRKLEELHGLAPADARRLLGKPDLLRRDGPAEVWQYASAACILDLFIWRGGGDPATVSHADLRAPGGGAADPACFNAMFR